jgi:peptide deformylase
MAPRLAVVTVTPISPSWRDVSATPRRRLAAATRTPLMAILEILEFPDTRLRTVARPVDAAAVTTPAFQQRLDDMFETMYEAPGIGLAASQVDVHERFMVIDISEDRSQPLVFVNPEIVEREGEQVYQEGCLSVPEIFADVTRANSIQVRAIGRDGAAFEMAADGLLAVCIQHEMDHLAGKLFVDYLSPLKREMVRKKLAKRKRA